MKTRSAKAKGRRLQNPVARILREVFGLKEADVHPALMGESGIDIKLSSAARRLIPFGFEAKNVERLNIWQAVAQAMDNAEDENLTPAVVIFRNRMKQPFVAIPFDTFIRLIHLDYATDDSDQHDPSFPKKPTAPELAPFREYMKTADEEEEDDALRRGQS